MDRQERRLVLFTKEVGGGGMTRAGKAGAGARVRKRSYWEMEGKQEPILPFPHFLLRVVLYAALAFSGILGWVLVGVLGYHGWGGLPWIDALLNASMIAAGMGPVDVLTSESAKIFASVYAIISGVLFISAVGFLLSPIVHRFLKQFHLEEGDDSEGGST